MCIWAILRWLSAPGNVLNATNIELDELQKLTLEEGHIMSSRAGQIPLNPQNPLIKTFIYTTPKI